MPHLQDMGPHSTPSFEIASKQSSRTRNGGHISGLRQQSFKKAQYVMLIAFSVLPGHYSV